MTDGPRSLPLVVTLPPWARSLRDAARDGLVTVAVLGFGAFAILALGWRGAAATPFVYFQVPWLMSAGLGGLALIGLALASWSIQDARRTERAETHLLHDAVAGLCAAADRGRS
jgi:hypothetical protein